MFYYTYLLRSLRDGKWYTGRTNDLRRRLDEHRRGESTYTHSRGPFKLIYYEACLSEEDSQAREKYLKSGMGKRFLKNRLKVSLKGINPVRDQSSNRV